MASNSDSSTEENPRGQLRSSKKAVQSADPPATLSSSGFVPTWSPSAARTEERGLLKNYTGGLSDTTRASPPHNASTSGQSLPSLNENANGRHDVVPTSPDLQNASSGQSIIPSSKILNYLLDLLPSDAEKKVKPSKLPYRHSPTVAIGMNCTGGLSDSSPASAPNNGTSGAHAVRASPNKGDADFLGKSHEASPVSRRGSSYDHPHVMEREMMNANGLHDIVPTSSGLASSGQSIIPSSKGADDHPHVMEREMKDSAQWVLPRELIYRHPTTVATPMKGHWDVGRSAWPKSDIPDRELTVNHSISGENSLLRSPINQVDPSVSLVYSFVLLMMVFVAWL